MKNPGEVVGKWGYRRLFEGGLSAGRRTGRAKMKVDSQKDEKRRQTPERIRKTQLGPKAGHHPRVDRGVRLRHPIHADRCSAVVHFLFSSGYAGGGGSGKFPAELQRPRG